MYTMILLHLKQLILYYYVKTTALSDIIFVLYITFQSLPSLLYLAFICATHTFSQSLFPHAKVSTFHNDPTQHNTHTHNKIKTDNPITFNKIYTF